MASQTPNMYMEDIQVRMDAIGVFEIKKFLRTYHLGPSPAFDQNIHASGETYGTVILPLWQQTTEFRNGMPFSEEHSKAKSIKERRPAAQTPALTIPHGSADNCFETVRLSAKIAPTSCPLQTTHPSKFATFAVIGRRLFHEGGIAVPALATEVHTTPFSGDRYELQFFIPELDD
ncbi:hypothetical protein V8E51_002385 [Hyaloscypha variabilis]